ncbi:MAG: peptidoglycan DD-metalloendopeptidase family protein [Evtepia sp.]
MRGTSQKPHDNLKEKAARFRRRQEEKSAAHPLRSSLPFLGIAGVILSGAVFVASCTLCYTINAQGQSVAYFRDQETYDAAVSQAEAKASRILETDYSLDQTLTLSTTLAPRDQIEPLSQVTDSILETIPELEHVYILSVDGTVVGAAQDSATITQALNLVKEHYTTPNTLSLQLDSQVSVRYAYLPAEAGVSTARELADLLLAESPRTFDYEVQEGDTLESLLERFSMTQERFQELNPGLILEVRDLAMGIDEEESDTAPAGETEEEQTEDLENLDELAALLAAEFGTPLEAGLTLTVEQSCPLLLVSTVEEQELSRSITPQLETQLDSTMFTGEQRIIQEGVAGEASVLSRVVTRCGVPIASTDLRSVTVTEAVPLIVGTGTQPKPQLPDGCLFLWPVQGTISSDYGYRFIFGETNFHRGIDIPAPMGTAINAAADGTVLFAGERGTYGNLVIISHDNGFVTYYAHCSKFLVQAGDQVTQGQPIAAVGSTGRSTGPHCHFEVRYQNTPIDPLLYLPGENNAPARTQVSEEQEPDQTPAAPETPAVPAAPAAPVQPEPPAEPAAPAEPQDSQEAISPAGEDPQQDDGES